MLKGHKRKNYIDLIENIKELKLLKKSLIFARNFCLADAHYNNSSLISIDFIQILAI